LDHLSKDIQSGVALRLPPRSKFFRPLRGLNYLIGDSILGLAPQALCCRALRALRRLEFVIEGKKF
jgi:hypothetical protein